MTTKNTNEEVATTTRKLKDGLSKAVLMLEAHTKAVERDLDLESENLKALVETTDPDVCRKIGLLEESLQDLHRSLADVRGELLVCSSEADQLARLFAEDGEAEASETEESSDDKVDMSAAEASKIRHDEPTTIGGILRSLLMANEPQQRDRRNSSSV